MRELAIIGATGGTGREVVAQALAAGHPVSALARDPSRLVAGVQRVVVGDARDPVAVARVISGAEAVIIALGTSASDRSGLRAEGTRLAVQAMQAAGVSRLVVLSVLGAHESRQGLDWFTRQILFRFWLQHAVADHEQQEEIVRASGLDWSLIRPPHLTSGRATGHWHSGFDMRQAPPAISVDRADVAALLLACALEGHHSRAAAGVVKAQVSRGTAAPPRPGRRAPAQTPLSS